MKMVQDTLCKEKRVHVKENKDLKNDIRALKVSVTYIHPNLQCYQVLLFVAYHRIM
jgi:hypothetical protein